MLEHRKTVWAEIELRATDAGITDMALRGHTPACAHGLDAGLPAAAAMCWACCVTSIVIYIQLELWETQHPRKETRSLQGLKLESILQSPQRIASHHPTRTPGKEGH